MHRFLIFVFINGVALSACSNAKPAVDLEADVEQVRAADRALLEAETNRDLDSAMLLFAEGAVLHPPDAPPILGREAL